MPRRNKEDEDTIKKAPIKVKDRFRKYAPNLVHLYDPNLDDESNDDLYDFVKK
jgi:hypothetical protein